jgi:DNA helicase HerA-like ATPase
LKPQEEDSNKYFTDFEGRFKGRLGAVIPLRFAQTETMIAGTHARYDCRIKVEYQKDLMHLIEEGMILAIENFKSTTEEKRYTLAEISRVFPEHFGLKGLSEYSYYPMQFEVIQQSVSDWKSDDKSTMMVQIQSIPINYDFLPKEDEILYQKGFTYPVIGEVAHVLNKGTINRMYNQKVLNKMKLDPRSIPDVSDARKNPRLGTIKMFEESREKIPIFIDYENLVRYHFGIFAFTGGGKSNLLSNILRHLVYHGKDTKIVIFDISCEYPFLLMDVFADKNVPSKIVLEAPITSEDQLYESCVKPREFEGDERAKLGFKKILDLNRIAFYRKPRFIIPTYAQFIEDISSQRKENGDKPLYIQALDSIYQTVLDYMDKNKLSEVNEISEDFVEFIAEKSSEIVTDLKVSDRSNVYGWATTRLSLLEIIKRAKQEERGQGLTTEEIQKLIEEPTKIVCLSIPDPYTIKNLTIDLCKEFLRKRKRQFQVKPYVLFVFDEAQEFIPSTSEAKGIERKCTDEVETLLRQGRKYGLGGCIATQRIAYLNTNALQQLHTYFVGTLPRPYDRNLVSETFTIDQTILEKTLEFAPGEWLLSSYIATGMENVPIFIKADNAEEEIKSFLSD